MIKFLFKRALTFCAVLAVASFMLDAFRPAVPLGIMIGGFVSVYKIRLYKIVFTTLTLNGKPSFAKTFFIFIFSISLSFILLFAAVKTDIRLFFGIAAGLVSVVAVICVNAVTEKIGVTQNNWGEK